MTAPLYQAKGREIIDLVSSSCLSIWLFVLFSLKKFTLKSKEWPLPNPGISDFLMDAVDRLIIIGGLNHMSAKCKCLSKCLHLLTWLNECHVIKYTNPARGILLSAPPMKPMDKRTTETDFSGLNFHMLKNKNPKPDKVQRAGIREIGHDVTTSRYKGVSNVASTSTTVWGPYAKCQTSSLLTEVWRCMEMSDVMVAVHLGNVSQRQH